MDEDLAALLDLELSSISQSQSAAPHYPAASVLPEAGHTNEVEAKFAREALDSNILLLASIERYMEEVRQGITVIDDELPAYEPVKRRSMYTMQVFDDYDDDGGNDDDNEGDGEKKSIPKRAMRMPDVVSTLRHNGSFFFDRELDDYASPVIAMPAAQLNARRLLGKLKSPTVWSGKDIEALCLAVRTAIQDHLESRVAREAKLLPEKERRIFRTRQLHQIDALSQAEFYADVSFIHWDDLADRYLPDRTGTDCRVRWIHHEQPTLRKGNWTQEEDEAIIAHCKDVSAWRLDVTMQSQTLTTCRRRSPTGKRCLLSLAATAHPSRSLCTISAT